MFANRRKPIFSILVCNKNKHFVFPNVEKGSMSHSTCGHQTKKDTLDFINYQDIRYILVLMIRKKNRWNCKKCLNVIFFLFGLNNQNDVVFLPLFLCKTILIAEFIPFYCTLHQQSKILESQRYYIAHILFSEIDMLDNSKT